MLARVAIALLGLVNTAIVARALPVETYATWATAMSLIALFTVLSDPGVSPVVMRWIGSAAYRAPSPLAVLRNRVALCFGVYALVVAGTWALHGERGAALALVLGAQIVPRGAASAVTVWLQSHHRQHLQSLAEFAANAVGTAIMLAAALLDAPAAALGALGFVLPSIALAAIARRQLDALPGIEHDLDSDVGMGGVWREVRPMAVAVLLATAYSRIDVFFVNAAETAAGTAHYLIAYQFVSQSLVLAGIVGITLMPLLVRQADSSDVLAGPVLPRVFGAIACIGICVGGVIALSAKYLILIAGGAGYRDARELLILLAPVVAGIFLNYFCAYLYVATERTRHYLKINIAAFAFTIVGSALFTLSYGAEAAAHVAVATEVFVVAINVVSLSRAGSARLMLPLPLLLGLVAACDAVVYLSAPLVVLLVPLAVTALATWSDVLVLIRSARTRSGDTPETGATVR